jgi:hypothetical protein
MAKAKTTQKSSNGKSVNSVRLSDVEPTPIQPDTAAITLLKARVDALEAAIDSLVRDMSRMKQIPSELVTHLSIMDRHTANLDSVNSSLAVLQTSISNYAAEIAKPKKRWGIF